MYVPNHTAVDEMHQLLPMANQVCCCATIAVVVAAAGLALPPFAVGDLLLGYECGGSSVSGGNYAGNNNVDMLLNWLPESAASSYPYFVNSTSGNGFGAVHAIALCRGDADSSACVVCLSAASQEVRTLCPSYSEATIYLDGCYISYSDNSAFIAPTSHSAVLAGAGTPTFTEPSFPGWINPNGDVHGANAIRRFVRASLEDTARWAAYNASDRFATGRVDGSSHGVTEVYSLAQCTPDMVPGDCWDCLEGLVDMTMEEFAGRQGGWRMSVRCGCRYETYPFYGGAATLLNGWPDVAVASAATDQDYPSSHGYGAPPAMPPGEAHKLVSYHGASRSGTVLKITIPITSAILALSIFCFYMKRRRQQAGTPSLPFNQEDIQIMESLILDLSTLKAATNNFEECNKLGEGGFGVVYKGVLPNGQVIAVKRLSHTSQQGINELKNEIILVGNLQHRNLVRLVGVSFQEEEKLLVYEYMPNRSLDTILFNRDRSNELDWEKRFKIISEIARGLQYLHEESRLKIIHRDLKANNILLDSNLSPKISDFGLAKLFEGDQSHVVTNRVAGTYGYMAPEYAMRGQYSVKSDVFSFGIIVLEIVTGRRSTDSYNNEQSVSLLDLIWQHWTMGTVIDLVDPSLLSSSSSQCSDDRDQMLRCMHIGLLCVQENPADRPMLSSVVLMLKDSSATPLRAPSRLAFWVHSADALPRYSSSGGELVTASPNHVSVTEVEAR